MSNVSKRKKEVSRSKIKTMGDHKEFLKRISKTLYYGQLPTLPCLSLPVTEISCSLWSGAQRGRSLRRLHADAAAGIARSACVSPCALVLAILYLERLKRCNSDYLAAAAPSDLFLVSLMVSNKFLEDDGEDDEVICSEWAASGGLELNQLKKLEIEFLNAIEWNVFVSEKSFESGLAWLEEAVALKQARLHGFFTYTDLAAARPAALVPALARACLAAALAYLTGLAALLASALLVSHLHLAATVAPAPPPATVSSADTNIITPDSNAPLDLLRHRAPTTNDTAQALVDLLAEDAAASLECCDRWVKYRERREAEWTRYDGVVVVHDWKSLEPWWSRSAVLNWLYQSSLVSAVQRWLEWVSQYAEPRCSRQWLHLSELSVLVASVSEF